MTLYSAMFVYPNGDTRIEQIEWLDYDECAARCEFHMSSMRGMWPKPWVDVRPITVGGDAS